MESVICVFISHNPHYTTLAFYIAWKTVWFINYKLTKKIVYSGKIKVNEKYWKLNSDFTKITNITAFLYNVNDTLLGPSKLLNWLYLRNECLTFTLKQPRDWLSSVLFILRVLQINSYANKKQIDLRDGYSINFHDLSAPLFSDAVISSNFCGSSSAHAVSG